MYPTLFRIGNFELSTFGLMLAIGFLVGGAMAARSFDKAGLDADYGWRLVTWCLIGGVLGAKLWHVAEQAIRVPDSSISSLLFSRAGLTWYGGLVGGAIAGLSGARFYKISLLTALNCSTPSLAAGQALGRIGCFLVGDDYGRVTDVPWGIAFPKGLPPTIEPVHPTMLHETFWLAAAAVWLWKRRGRSPFLFGEYLVLAGSARLWIEEFRTNPALWVGLTNAQVVAVTCIVIGVVGWIYYFRKRTS